MLHFFFSFFSIEYSFFLVNILLFVREEFFSCRSLSLRQLVATVRKNFLHILDNAHWQCVNFDLTHLLDIPFFHSMEIIIERTCKRLHILKYYSIIFCFHCNWVQIKWRCAPVFLALNLIIKVHCRSFTCFRTGHFHL